MIRVGKMNMNGHALVEFIIILPVIIFIIMLLVDFMTIISYKNKLESNMNNVTILYKENKIDEINQITNNQFNYQIKDNYTYLQITEDYKTITPGLSLVLGNPYVIKCERVILNEQ